MTDRHDGVPAFPSVTGYWVGKELFWKISGVSEDVSDRDLRSFIFKNNRGYNRHVGPCVLNKHVKQYADAARSEGKS